MTKLVLSFALLSALALPYAAGCSSDDARGADDDSVSDDALASKKCGGFTGATCPAGATCVDDPSDSCDPTAGGRDCIGQCTNVAHAAFCGGFAGIQCPTGYVCVDNPNDGCDPSHGGADCGGICLKKTGGGTADAGTGTKPDAGGTHPTGAICGGFAGLQCPAGETCVDDPDDGCDPMHGGADCSGRCVPQATGAAHCGGIAGLPCPKGQTCVDDPNDGCGPMGSDCPGICM